ncbi:MAG: DNA-directed RNA polymerase subunit beta [Parcubacteria group bacterium Gr01-1014_38]|nr:MAG: DNA-directed RNA polymerase subunit beta [Parcubacteria group bacterium Gr01-1014_38]
MEKRSAGESLELSSDTLGRSGSGRPSAPPAAPLPIAAEASGERERRYFTAVRDAIPLPHLVSSQLESYQWFLREGLQELFDEFNLIEAYGRAMTLEFLDYYLDEPKHTEKTARERNATLEAAIRVAVRLTNKKSGEVKEQEVYLGDFPIMTPRGTFVINGVERVVVSQLIRSPGVLFTVNWSRGRNWYGAKVIPNRGAWLEIETEPNGVLVAKIDRRRKVVATALLRAFGLGTNEEILAAFAEVDTDPNFQYIDATLAKDPTHSHVEGLLEVYRRLRPGDLATPDNARQMVEDMFFRFDRYDFGRVGRHRLNVRLNVSFPEAREHRILHQEDLIAILREVVRLNVAQEMTDDIDHLGNRRVRAIGELVQNKFRVGLQRLKRIAQDRMSTMDVTTVTPAQLINARPVIAAIKEFFSSSQLSQLMDQTNPLSELEHKRRLSAMGPGGLPRERAGFEVRDVHHSHYGRICPIESPEGPNIGLVGHMANFARVNAYGFLETPYRKVLHEVPVDAAAGEETNGDVRDPSTGEILVPARAVISPEQQARLVSREVPKVRIRPKVTDEIAYLDAHQEDRTAIAQATEPLTDRGQFLHDIVEARDRGQFREVSVDRVEYVDVSPIQCISVASSLVPFLEHDDAQRALMGSNMQRQAVSCVLPEAPVVGTGIERRAATDSAAVVLAESSGTVASVDAEHVTVLEDEGATRTYPLRTFLRSNNSMSIMQRPVVSTGQRVERGTLLADGASTDQGELALGRNLLIAFLPWRGGNFEDAILISERVVRGDLFTSVHIEEFSIDVRDTKLGPEVVTRDIPNVGEEKLRNLGDDGIIRIGAEVNQGDILVGKISPKGETDLTAEERLLRAIFGEKARDVKDTSLYLQHGEHGKVVDIRTFDREKGDKLPSGVLRQVQVSVAQLRKLQVGDKLAGRHGNKGVISRIVPEEDMPYLEDGTPVDIILNPLGVASRMNIGQILEAHLGWAASKLGYRLATPPFNGATEGQIRAELKKAGLPEDGKVALYDGITGEPFDHPVTVGVMYIMKLHHLVEDKIHMRSTGPYSLVTQQPLGGKAQSGGQRFGEMEVWALEGYGAAYTLQEMLTIKSDDVLGRSKTYEAIVKGEPIQPPHVPASFDVLVRELKGLVLDVELVGKKKAETAPGEEKPAALPGAARPVRAPVRTVRARAR